MLGKPRILSLFPNSFNKFNRKEHSCKILYVRQLGESIAIVLITAFVEIVSAH